MKKAVYPLLIVVTSILTIVAMGRAAYISNTSNECSDLLLIFARGSSDNKEKKYLDDPFSDDFESVEKISGSFFNWMEKRLLADYPHINYKAVSIHNSGNGWSERGYPAVGIFGPSTINNIFDAELSWWPAGEYRDSVASGIAELKGQINYEVTRCPNQRIVVGGYSQGANVVGDALFEIPIVHRNLIDNVVLFGDPKFIGADYNKYNLLDKPKAYPWHRGTAGLRERGANDARVPYVPDDMKYKTISWCHEDDFVCTGFSGLGWGITNHELPSNDNSIWQGPVGALGDGHTRYPFFGVPEATEEVVRNLHTHLSALEIARGGIDANLSPYLKFYDGTLKVNRPIDVMFAMNYTGGIEDALHQHLTKSRNILQLYQSNFTNLKTGSVSYTDMAGGTARPHQSYVAGYSQQPNQLSANMSDMFRYVPYLYGGLGGGGDYPENHGMAIERAGMFTNWRPDATKHLVIFAERPAHEEYSFNMCDSSVYSAFRHNGASPCIVGQSHSTSVYPMWCPTMYHVRAEEECLYTNPNPSVNIVYRQLADAVTLARSKGFVVDIIQPHAARNNQPSYTPQYVEDQLRNLAESTGGLYLKYNTFNEPELRDALWRILASVPKTPKLAYYEPGSFLDFNTMPTYGQAPQLIELITGQSHQFAVEPVSGARSYGWDFDGDGRDDHISEGPSALYEPPSDLSGFVNTRAYSSPDAKGDELARSAIPYRAVFKVPSPIYLPTVVGLPDQLHASRESGTNQVTLSWAGEFTEYDLMLVKDPLSRVITYSVPAKLLRATFTVDDSMLDQIIVQYVSSAGGESDDATLPVTLLTPSSEGSDPSDDPSDPPPADDSAGSDPSEGFDPSDDPAMSESGDSSGEQQQTNPANSPQDADPPGGEATPPGDETASHSDESPVQTGDIPHEDSQVDNGDTSTHPPEDIIELPVIITLPDDTTAESSVRPDDDPVGITDDVGLTAEKQVSQKEPNAAPPITLPSEIQLVVTETQSGNSARPINPQATSVSLQRTTASQSITAVQSATQTNTNPQSDVGGLDDVQKLFPGEPLEGGSNEPDAPELTTGSNKPPLLLYAAAIALIITLLLLALALFRRKDDKKD